MASAEELAKKLEDIRVELRQSFPSEIPTDAECEKACRNISVKTLPDSPTP